MLIVLATSSTILNDNFNNFSGDVSTPSARNHFSSSAFSESINTTKIPFFCALRTIFPDAMYDLPDAGSPAKTVTLPNGMPL